MSPQAPQHDCFLLRKHEVHRVFWCIYFRVFPYQERPGTTLCLSPDTLWNLLLYPLVSCFWLFHWRCVPSYPHQNSLMWLVSAPRPKSKLFLCLTCYSLTMMPWQHTPREQCWGSSTNSPAYVKTLAWQLASIKTNASAHDVRRQAPVMRIGDHTLDVVDEFTYLGSTISMTEKSPEESAKPSTPCPNWQREPGNSPPPPKRQILKS